MNRTIEDIQKDIELLGIKGGYDIEELLTPQDCRRLSYETERLNNIINELEKGIKENIEELEEHQLSRDRIDEDKEILRFLQELKGDDKNDKS